MLPGALASFGNGTFHEFIPSFSSVDSPLRTALLGYAHRRTMRRGDLLLAQGDPSAYVFFIETGNVLTFRCNTVGREIAFSYLGPGDACGLEDGLSGHPYSCAFQAVAPGVVWCVLADNLRVLIGSFPVLAEAVIGYMADRLRSAMEHLELVTLDDLSTRVRKTLLRFLATTQASQGPVLLPLTQSHLAALVGASRQRTNVVLGGLHRIGIVDSRTGGILVRDPSALRLS